MARLLVKAISHTHPDPTIDAQGAYKRGDIVVIMPDGHVWGNSEGLPTFEQVDMPGVSVEDVKHLALSKDESIKDITSIAMRKNTRMMRMVSRTKERKTLTRRRHQINLDTLQTTDKSKV